MTEPALRYVETVRAYGARHGMLNHYVVIDRKLDPDAWHEWRRYFRSVGMAWSARHMATAERWTVPTKHPRDFDASAP
jgi:hypothetical protein